MGGLDGLAKEDGGHVGKGFGLLGGEVAGGGALGEALLHVGVPTEIVGKAVGYVFALWHEAHGGGKGAAQLGEEEGIVGAAEDDGVDEGVALEELVDVLLYEVVGSGAVGLAVLDEWHPEGAGLAGDVDVGGEFVDFDVVGVAAYGAGGGKDADVACAGELAYGFGRGAYDAEHAPGGVDGGEVALLYGAQGLGGGRVAGEDDEGASHTEEAAHGLEGELIDDGKGARAVGGSRVVAKVEVVVLGHELLYLPQYGETSVAGVKNAYGTHNGNEE